MTAPPQRGPATQHHAPPLSVRDLHVTYRSDHGQVQAVRGASFTVGPGEVVGIVGESGCGKSAIARALLGLLPRNAEVTGSIDVNGVELVGSRESTLRGLRGASIALVPQDPATSLNPVYTIGWQLVEAMQAHQQVGRAAAWRRATEMLDLVGIPDARARVHAYPYQLSGGMRQRVVIAMALVNDPAVIIADEPTTALDVTVQAQVLDSLARARESTGVSIVLITHDLGIVAGTADRVLVMYAGALVEIAPVDELFANPRMPYTTGLLRAFPSRRHEGPRRLLPIRGRPPSLSPPPPGCAFAPRCPAAQDVCRSKVPPLLGVADDHRAACHFADTLDPRDVVELFTEVERQHANQRATIHTDLQNGTPVGVAIGDPDSPLLELVDVVKHYPVRGKGMFRRGRGVVHAVCGVNLQVRSGETLGMVGESGSGKSTLARTMLSLEPPTGGAIRYSGSAWNDLDRTAQASVRRSIQVVLQDPYSSLDPRLTVHDIVSEPLRIHGVKGAAIRERVRDLLAMVDLAPAHADRYPHQFSGGQRQRIGIARALALEPQVLVLDEPVSSLDVSVQAGIVNLLVDLQRQLSMSYVFVSHDLGVVNHLADRVAVMYAGKIVEQAPTDVVFDRPAHPYTVALLSAMRIPDPPAERARRRIVLVGDPPSPATPPAGCRFAGRCPKYREVLDADQQSKCLQESPELYGPDAHHTVACHWPDGDLSLVSVENAAR